MTAFITIFAIISFVTSIFLWIYDSETLTEKYTLPAIAITAGFTLISLIFIAPPHTFSHTEVQILIVLFFIVVFMFLTLAEEDKLRVILFGAALAVIITIIFMKELLPIEEIDYALDNEITDIAAYLTSQGWKNLPLPLEQLIEITEVPALLFEVTVFSAFIEWEVISIVFGMSLLVAVLSDTGLFDMVSIRTIKMSEGVPKKFLILVFFLTLVLSALLDNTTAIILLAGITITVT
ncbi:MAG: SLC13 family permease, partial [Candidatus Hodarchaeales archaeon]